MKIIKKPTDFFAGAIFGAIALFAISIVRNYPRGSLRVMGPGYYPLVISVALGLLGTVLMVRSFVGEKATPISMAPLPILVVSASLVTFTVLLKSAGLPIAIAVLVLGSSVASGRFKVVTAAILAVGLAVGCTLMFVYALGMQLPVFEPWGAIWGD